eukprot:361857-Chlamydomonas_euryale.AAC.2
MSRRPAPKGPPTQPPTPAHRLDPLTEPPPMLRCASGAACHRIGTGNQGTMPVHTTSGENRRCRRTHRSLVASISAGAATPNPFVTVAIEICCLVRPPASSAATMLAVIIAVSLALAAGAPAAAQMRPSLWALPSAGDKVSRRPRLRRTASAGSIFVRSRRPQPSRNVCSESPSPPC